MTTPEHTTTTTDQARIAAADAEPPAEGPAEATQADCCSPAEQRSCCDAEDKAECCGATSGERCGCR